MTYTYEYPRPALTTDAAVFTRSSDYELKVLLIQRKNPPFLGFWAFPGGFVEINEPLKDSAIRELEEETGLKNVPLQQFRTYGTLNRDPRGRTVSVVYYGFVEEKNARVRASDDANEAQWFPISYLPKLAFDHQQILNDLLKELNLE
ncbi:MAG: NUDIX hydrolase [Bacteroidales bacterium]|nr:NUDIX hydrolase [Bacteroidales bacterium]MCF8334129.1 NUDIX hydrolase [Bacteroidales bacterium]